MPSHSPLLPQRDWASLRTELIWIYDREVPATDLRRNESGEGYKAWLIRSGAVTITSRSGKTTRGRAGDWVFPPQGYARHAFSGVARILSVHFICRWPTNENLFADGEGWILAADKRPELENRAAGLERLIRQHQPGAPTGYAHQMSDFRLFLEFQASFLGWLEEWVRLQIEHGAEIRGQGAGDDRLLRAVRCLNEAPLDRAFPRENLERDARLGEAQLNRLFLQQLGVTTRKYWERRKLEFAKICLETTAMPVKEVAYRLAFRSDSHFVLWFRRLTQKRPGEFRRLAQ